MKVGILVHSKTGNTLRFAHGIADKLREGSHSLTIVELKMDGDAGLRTDQARIVNDKKAYRLCKELQILKPQRVRKRPTHGA